MSASAVGLGTRAADAAGAMLPNVGGLAGRDAPGTKRTADSIRSDILVIDSEAVTRELFSIWLEGAGHTVLVADSVPVARSILRAGRADIVIGNLSSAQADSRDLLSWMRDRDPQLPVILVARRPAIETAVDALRMGVHDLLVKPVDKHELLRVVDRAVTHWCLVREKRWLEEENARYRRHLEDQVAFRTQALKRRNQQLLTINELSSRIFLLDDQEALYERVARALEEGFGLSDVAVFSVDETTGRPALEAGAREEVPAADPGSPAGLRAVVERALATGEAVISGCRGGVSDGERERAGGEGSSPGAGPGPGGGASAGADLGRDRLSTNAVGAGGAVSDGSDEDVSRVAVPVRVGEDIVAVLVIAEHCSQAFDELDVTVLRTLADHASVAIRNSRLLAQLREALMAREQMLANVSHELRSPLSVITVWAEMLLDDALGEIPPEALEAIGTIQTSANHLAHLVNLLLAFQRLDRAEMAMRELSLEALARASVASWAPILERYDIRLELEVAEDSASAVPVLGNEDYLRQVFHNLLDNARKFSPDGGVTRVAVFRQGDEVFVRVTDSGVGVETDQLPRLFERFYQADGGPTRRFEGMGLGLSLSHEIVRRHGGRIWAESPGDGSGLSVSFALPVAPSALGVGTARVSGPADGTGIDTDEAAPFGANQGR